MSSGHTTVFATALQDASGNLVDNATIRFAPVDNHGHPISFKTGGTAFGQTISAPVHALVTNGAFSLSLADTSLTIPQNIAYAVTVVDNVTNRQLLGEGYGEFQPTGSSFDFGTYSPNLTALGIVGGSDFVTADGVTILGIGDGRSMVPLFTKVGNAIHSTAVDAVFQPSTGSTVFAIGDGSYQVPIIIKNGSQLQLVNVAGAPSGGGSVPATVPPPTRLVADRCNIPDGSQTIFSGLMGRTRHTAKDTIAAGTMKVIYATYWANGPEHPSAMVGGIFKVAVEYPVGVITPLTFSGSGSIVAGASDMVTDAGGPFIPNGAVFWLRSFYSFGDSNTHTILRSNWRNHSASVDQFEWTIGGSVPVDKTTSGTVTDNAYGSGFWPIAIIAPTAKPTIGLFGDSIQIGAGDTVNDPNGYCGIMERIIGPEFAFINFGDYGTTPSTAISSGNYNNRMRMVPYCTQGINEYGTNQINDIGSADTTAQVVADRGAFNAMVNLPMIGVTLLPKTSSTDNWATTANQTKIKDLSAFNLQATTGKIAGESLVLDVVSLVDPTHTGLWPVGPVPLMTSGVAYYGTADGVHPNANVNTLIQQRGSYVTNWIRARN